MRSLLICSALVLLAASAATASADAVAVPQPASRVTLVPAGGVLDTQQFGSRLVRLTPGGRRVKVFEAQPTSAYIEATVNGVATSTSRVVYGVRRSIIDGDEETASRLITGRLGGPYRRVPQADASAFDLDGDLLLFHKRNVGYVVRDLTGGNRDVAVGPPDAASSAADSALVTGPFTPQIAGSFAAYGTLGPQGELVVSVVSWQTRQPVYDLAVPGGVDPYPGGPHASFDLAPDGTVTVLRADVRARDRLQVAWASPSEPVLHALVDHAGPLTPRLAAGRVLAERPVGDLQRQFALVDLAGASTPVSFPFAALTDESASPPAADWDGSRVAYALGACTYLHASPLAAPEQPPVTGCPQTRVQVRVLPAGRGGVRVAVRCLQGPTSGCHGRLDVRSVRDPQTFDLGPTLVRATVARTAVGASRTYRLRIQPRRLRQLERSSGKARTVEVDAIVTSPAQGGPAARSDGAGDLRLP